MLNIKISKAKKIIPGGNQLLSKRSEIILPKALAQLLQKAKDCRVWDLDNKCYYDFAGMGVTSCILGYANKELNTAIKAVDEMCTLNAVEEYHWQNLPIFIDGLTWLNFVNQVERLA